MFIDIKNILPKSVERSGAGRQIEAAKIIEVFDNMKNALLPGHIASKAKALYIRSGVLYIASLSGIVTQELKYKESDIIEYINKAVGREAVKKIRFLA